MANAYLADRNPIKAISLYEQAIKLNPGERQWRINYCDLLIEQGRLEQAAQFIQVQIFDQMGDTDWFVRLCLVQILQGDYSKAQATIQDILAHNEECGIAIDLMNEISLITAAKSDPLQIVAKYLG